VSIETKKREGRRDTEIEDWEGRKEENETKNKKKKTSVGLLR
jgi:hypothetical protein